MFILVTKQKMNHISHITKKFQCPICLEFKSKQFETLTKPCNHRFCNECIQHWIENSKRDSECPVCRAKILDVMFQGKTIQIQQPYEVQVQQNEIDMLEEELAELEELANLYYRY